MHLRRALLLFALVLGLTALAAAVSPSRETDAPAVAPSPSTPPSAALARPVTFQTGRSVKPQVRRARAGEHIVIVVSATEGGLVTIPRLGRTSSVSPAAPARFDVLAPAPGRYDVLLEPSGDPRAPIVAGTLVTRP